MTTDNLKPGTELDKIVAERIMGWTQEGPYLGWYFWAGEGSKHRRVLDWGPSTDIAAAFEVLDKVWPLVNHGNLTYRIQLNRMAGSGEWVCHLATDPRADWSTHKVGKAMTAAHAICLAALKAIEK